jgi:hypothetical protein
VFWHHADLLAYANISEKHTVSISSPKRWHLLMSLHGTKTQKIIIIILTTVKTSNQTTEKMASKTSLK